MPELLLDPLVAPLSSAEPSGPYLEYDPEITKMIDDAQGKPERQAGEQVLPSEAPQWGPLYPGALAAAERTRDLRVAVLLTRAGAHVKGIRGYADGVRLVARLIDELWDSVHPQLDKDDGNDATERLNKLAPLCDMAVGLSDLRLATVIAGPKALTVRQLELAYGRIEPLPGETKPQQKLIVAALKEHADGGGEALLAMRQAHEAVTKIERVINQRLSASIGPDWRPLRRITECLEQVANLAMGKTNASADAAATTFGGAQVVVAATAGDIRSRDDVVRVLNTVCDWVEANEPSNPAPLLLRRAQRLMSKSFMEIVRDLAPEGLVQVERIAGLTPDA